MDKFLLRLSADDVYLRKEEGNPPRSSHTRYFLIIKSLRGNSTGRATDDDSLVPEVKLKISRERYEDYLSGKLSVEGSLGIKCSKEL